MITYDEFSKAAETRRPDRSEARHNLRALRQAAVSASELTGHPAWDRFLSYVQGALEGAQAQRIVALEEIGNPATIDADHIAWLRAQAIRLGAHMEILRAVIALPGDLMRDGEKARGLLERLGEQDGEADA